jgi:hypothetical protein
MEQWSIGVLSYLHNLKIPLLHYSITPTFQQAEKTLGRAPHIGFNFFKDRLRCSSDQR